MFIPLVKRKTQNYSEEPMNIEKALNSMIETRSVLLLFVGFCWDVFLNYKL